jgi:hypothetical protein
MTSSSDMRVVGFLDDDDSLHGSLLNELALSTTPLTWTS